MRNLYRVIIVIGAACILRTSVTFPMLFGFIIGVNSMDYTVYYVDIILSIIGIICLPLVIVEGLSIRKKSS